jgi:hypothetical protein
MSAVMVLETMDTKSRRICRDFAARLGQIGAEKETKLFSLLKIIDTDR